ncbi:MAG: hypothetical protein KJZ92_17465 [Rhodocyclaceae bacterium]|nr:hypothetical protein [Rhodocyclaceae bacterium]
MSRPTYRAAIEWIAANDNPGAAEPSETLKGYLTVALVADLFGVDVKRAAEDVANFRNKQGAVT